MVFSSEKSVYYSCSEGTDRQSAKPSSGSSFLLAWAAERDNTIWASHEAVAGGAWSLRVSPLAPSSFLERRTGLAIALHPCHINTVWYMSGCWWHWDEGLKGQMQKWFGRNWQRLTYQRTNCLCPKNFKYSSSLPNKLVKAALEIFVIKLNMAGENILNFDLLWEALCQWRYKKPSHLSIKGHGNFAWAMAAKLGAAVVQIFGCYRPSTEFILKQILDLNSYRDHSSTDLI